MGRILFDITPASWIANGSGIYTRYVFEQLIQNCNNIDAFYLDEGNFDDKLTEIANVYGCKVIRCKNTAEIEDLIHKQKYSKVYFGALKNTEVTIREDITPIVTVHDLRFIEINNDETRYKYAGSLAKKIKLYVANLLNLQIDRKRYINNIVKFINHPRLQIITVSEHTKYSIFQHFPSFPKENIQVFYCPLPLPLELANIATVDLEKKYGLSNQSYLLLTSANRWFKNAYRAIKALDKLIDDKQLADKKIVVLGTKEAKGLKKVNNPNQFIFLDYVPIDELESFYKNAFCFIYPSLQEGFGIPPLEAMRYGTPVIASVNSSITEICDRGVLFFNPYLLSEIGNRLLQLIYDKDLYKRMKERALGRYEEVSKKQKDDSRELINFITTVF